MISILSKDQLLTHSKSLVVTYPRTVQITFGNYPYPEEIHNIMIKIKNKISKENSYATNVKAGMTGWQDFINEPFTTKFINYCINKHQVSNPNLFKFFYETKTIVDAWGNEVKNNDYVEEHDHLCYHGILYLTKGSPLILPELNISITPNPGDYYFFPPLISHKVEESTNEENRYNLVLNITEKTNWKKRKYIFEKTNSNPSVKTAKK